MSTFKRLKFNCGSCGQALEASQHAAVQRVSCPRCAKNMTLTVRRATARQLPVAVPLPAAMPRQREPGDQSVPIKMGLGQAGSFETAVSRKDAGRMAQTFLGGLLFALGVIVCAILGINFSKRS